MEAVSGVFKTRVAAERAVHEAARAGIPADRVTLLTPGSVDHLEKEMQSVPTDTAEQPGIPSTATPGACANSLISNLAASSCGSTVGQARDCARRWRPLGSATSQFAQVA